MSGRYADMYQAASPMHHRYAASPSRKDSPRTSSPQVHPLKLPLLHALLRGRSPATGSPRRTPGATRASSAKPLGRVHDGRSERKDVPSVTTPRTRAAPSPPPRHCMSPRVSHSITTPINTMLSSSKEAALRPPTTPTTPATPQTPFLSRGSVWSPSTPRRSSAYDMTTPIAPTPIQQARKSSAASTHSSIDTIGHSDTHSTNSEDSVPCFTRTPRSTAKAGPISNYPTTAWTDSPKARAKEVPPSPSISQGLSEYRRRALSAHASRGTKELKQPQQSPVPPAAQSSTSLHTLLDNLQELTQSAKERKTHAPVLSSIRQTPPAPATPTTPAVPTNGGRVVPAQISNMVCTWTANNKEDQNKYAEGGYMRVAGGQVLGGRYHVIEKLGWGEFATVWLCWDQNSMQSRPSTPTAQFVAVKVSKCASHVGNAAKEEAALLRYIGKYGQGSGAASLTRLLEVFEEQGSYGKHVCMVFPVLGQNILCLVEQAHRYREKLRSLSGMPVLNGLRRSSEDLRFIKSCVRATLRGLAELHRLQIVHTDLKPENILLTTVSKKVREHMRTWQDSVAKARGIAWDEDRLVSTADTPTDMEKESSFIRISDFGLSSLLDPEAKQHGIGSHTRRLQVKRRGVASNPLGVILQTREYRAPEVLFGSNITCTTDVWSVACMTYELVTGTFLMDPKKDPKRRQKPEEEINADHICMMQQLIGTVPVHVATGTGKHLPKYFDDTGSFLYRERYEKNFGRRSLKHELTSFVGEQEAAELSSFIRECLMSFDPMQRPSADHCLRHTWLRH